MRFDQPVGTQAQRDSNEVWSGGWVDATGYATLYKDSGGNAAYHTGADLNLNTPFFDADAHGPVYASADGVVTYAGPWAVWGNIVVIKHPNGFCTRYGHVELILVRTGQVVVRGQQIASIGKPTSGPYHLHFDIARKDLSVKPSDWPGLNIERVKADYVDPKQYIIDSRRPEVPMAIELETADRLNLRISPDVSATRITVMPAQTKVTQIATDPDNQWANLQVPAIINGQAVTLQGWASRQWLRPLVVEPPSSQGLAKYLLGVHVLNFAEEAEDAFANGCRCAHVMGSFVGDWNLHIKYPDAVVIRRRYLSPGQKPNPQQMVELLGVDPRAGQACTGEGMYVFTLSNEGDVIGAGNAAEFEALYHWEVECARRIHAIAPKAKVALLSAAHGNPDWLNADIRGVFNRLYVPFIRANREWVVVDTHSYTLGKRFPSHPPSGANIYAPIYLETRNQLMHASTKALVPELAYACCELPDGITHISGESGVEAGAGGFNWAGYTPTQFKEWCIEWLKLQRNSGAPYSAAAVFQYSRRTDWAGYDIRGFKDVLRDLWLNDVKIAPTFSIMGTHGAIDDAPPAGYVPARKEFHDLGDA